MLRVLELIGKSERFCLFRMGISVFVCYWEEGVGGKVRVGVKVL